MLAFNSLYFFIKKLHTNKNKMKIVTKQKKYIEMLSPAIIWKIHEEHKWHLFCFLHDTQNEIAVVCCLL